MQSLSEEIESRLKECLPANDQSSPMGYIQWETCLSALQRGELLIVRRHPGGFPEVSVQNGVEV